MSSSEASTSQLLTTEWFDSAWIPALNQYNVLDYFSQRSNPFYVRTCNNEVLKMQRADPAQLVNMKGIEYMLLHVQEPILYVIRKVHRQSQDKVTPLADYYILGGRVYQCPDFWSVINSRLLSTLHLVNEAFNEITTYARYDPTKGHYWEFPDDKSSEEKSKTAKTQLHTEEPSETQRRRVDLLLNDLIKKFPPKAFARKDGGKPNVVGGDKAKDSAAAAGVKRQQQQFSGDVKQPDPKRKRT